jgi:membrane protease YdiL (CAAX protease family)
MEEPSYIEQPGAQWVEPRLDYFDQFKEPDPDNPHWGALAGVGGWVISIVAPIILQFIVLIPWAASFQITHGGPPTQEQVEAWVYSARGALLLLVLTIISQLITIAACWMIVTRNRKEPFLKSLGWHWAGMNNAKRFGFVAGVVAGMFVLEIILAQVLPDNPNTAFHKIINSSQTNRILVVVMAVLAAPIVEEVLYRGVLYSGLRRAMGTTASVIVVTVLFTAIHVPQYVGAWAGLTALALLSFVLTLIRAKTGSILPCVAVHLVFNSVASVGILMSGAGK